MKYKLKPGWTVDRVLAQFVKYNTGKAAVDDAGICVYQAEDGNRCAIGCFIPDGHRGLECEDRVFSLLSEYPDLREHMPFDNVDALRSLQTAHDACDSDTTHEVIIAWLRDHVVEGDPLPLPKEASE